MVMRYGSVHVMVAYLNLVRAKGAAGTTALHGSCLNAVYARVRVQHWLVQTALTILGGR